MQTNKNAYARAASLSDSNKYVRITRKKKDKNGVLRSNKSPRRAHRKHHVIQRYCVICKKAGMPEHKYMSHIAKDCTCMRTNRTIKYGMGGFLGSRADTVKHYKKS